MLNMHQDHLERLEKNREEAKIAAFSATTFRIGQDNHLEYDTMLKGHTGWCDLLLMSELPESRTVDKGKMYLEKRENQLRYLVKDPQGNLVEGILDINIAELNQDILAKLKPQILELTSLRGHTPPPVTPDSRFQAASLSKPVFAYLVLKLAQDKQVDFDLDTKLHKILKDERFSKDSYHEALTPRIILSHQSGLPTRGDDSAKSIDFQFKPGTKYGYSGVAISYLQKVIEKKTGLKLEELAQKYVFSNPDPDLTMNNSTFTPPDGKEENAQGANSLSTTGTDYAKFMVACLKEKEMFESIATMDGGRDDWAMNQGLSDEDLKKVGWGIGWGLQKSNDGKKVTMAFHSGDMSEWRAFAAIDLEKRQGVVYFSNSRNGLVLADQIITPIVDLDAGFKYIFEKYGFSRKLEEDWQDKESVRVMNIIEKNEPLTWKKIQESNEAKEKMGKWFENEQQMEPSVKDEIIKALWNQLAQNPDLSMDERVVKFSTLKGFAGIKGVQSAKLDLAIRQNNFDQFESIFAKVPPQKLADIEKYEYLALHPVDLQDPVITEEDIHDLKKYMQDKEISASVSISNNGKIYSASSENLEEPNPIFSIHSIGKVFTGILAMKMIHEGTLPESALNEPIKLDENVLDALSSDVQERLKNVTLKQLMLHESGLGDYLKNQADSTEEALNKGENAPPVNSSNDLLKYGDKSVVPSGSYHYSNLGILLVGFALEKAHNDHHGLKGENRIGIDQIMRDFAKNDVKMNIFDTHMPANGRFNAADQFNPNVQKDPMYLYRYVAARFGNPAGGYCTTTKDLQKFGAWICRQNPEFKRLIKTHGGEFYRSGKQAVSHSGLHADSAHFYTSLRNGTTISVLSDQGGLTATNLVDTILKQTTWFKNRLNVTHESQASPQEAPKQAASRLPAMVRQFNAAAAHNHPASSPKPTVPNTPLQDASQKPKRR